MKEREMKVSPMQNLACPVVFPLVKGEERKIISS